MKTEEGRKRIGQNKKLDWIKASPEKHKERVLKSTTWTKTEEGKKKLSQYSDWMRTEEGKKKISEGQKERFSKPGEVEKCKQSQLKWIKENPDKEFERRQKANESLRKPKVRKANSKRRKEYYKNNPEERIKHGKKIKEVLGTPEKRKEMSDSINKMYEERPEVKDKIRKSVSKIWKDPEYQQKVKDAQKLQWEVKKKCIKVCEDVIKENKLDVKLPSKRSSHKIFVEFEKVLLEKIKEGKGV
jgi:hypothetical protein